MWMEGKEEGKGGREGRKGRDESGGEKELHKVIFVVVYVHTAKLGI